MRRELDVGGKVRQAEKGKQVCMYEEGRAEGQAVKKGRGWRKTEINHKDICKIC